LECGAPPEPVSSIISCSNIADAVVPTHVPELNSVFAKVKQEAFTEEGARVNRIILQALTRSMYNVYASFPIVMSVESVLGTPATNAEAYEAGGGVARLISTWEAQRVRCLAEATEASAKMRVADLKKSLTSKGIKFAKNARRADLLHLHTQSYLTFGNEAFEPIDHRGSPEGQSVQESGSTGPAARVRAQVIPAPNLTRSHVSGEVDEVTAHIIRIAPSFEGKFASEPPFCVPNAHEQRQAACVINRLRPMPNELALLALFVRKARPTPTRPARP